MSENCNFLELQQRLHISGLEVASWSEIHSWKEDKGEEEERSWLLICQESLY